MNEPKQNPADDKRTLWYLRKIRLLEPIPREDLAQLVPHVEIREIKRRQVVYLPGDPSDSVFFLVGGRVKCSKVSRDGKELTLSYRGAGQMFGELGALDDDSPREEMVEAMKNAIMLEVPAELFRGLLRQNAELCFGFVSMVGKRRRDMEKKLEHLAFGDVHAKLAFLLLELAKDYGLDTERGREIDLKITHQEMANLIGSTRETISTTLAQFKKKNLIHLSGRTVTIQDSKGLEALT